MTINLLFLSRYILALSTIFSKEKDKNKVHQSTKILSTAKDVCVKNKILDAWWIMWEIAKTDESLFIFQIIFFFFSALNSNVEETNNYDIYIYMYKETGIDVHRLPLEKM